MPVVLPLIELSALLIALAAIAIALLIVDIMRNVGNLVQNIWLIGGALASGVDAVAQGIQYVLGKAEAGVDSAIGASWHALAWFARAWWHEIEGEALAVLGLAELVARLVYAHAGLRALVHYAEHVVHGIEHGVKSLERRWHGIEARVKQLERDITVGIGHDLRVGLRDLENEVHGIEKGTIPALVSGIDAVEGELTQLENFIGAIPGTTFLAWAATIVAAAIGTVGLKALRCSGFGNLFNRLGCGMWSILDGLLGLVVSSLILTNVCDILFLLETAYGDVSGPLVSFLNDIPLGGCELPPSGWATFAVTIGALPPSQTLGALAP